MFAINNAAKNLLERDPPLWRLVQYLRYRNSHRICRLVTPTHNVVLEGYPRSGNSFAVRAFLHSNGTEKDWAIATHFHSFAQVSLAAKWKRPTAVFVRNPREAVLSLAAHSVMKNHYSLDDSRSLEHYFVQSLSRYIDFHKSLLSIADQVVISDFSTTTSDFSLVIKKLNQKFDTDFRFEEDHSRIQDGVFKIGAKHLSPDEERSDIKRLMENFLEKEAISKKLFDAEIIYFQVREYALVC